jgi:hypothetical protein
MIATVRPVETDKSGGSTSSTTMVERMPAWAGPAVAAAESAGEREEGGGVEEGGRVEDGGEGEEGMAKSGCRIVVFRGSFEMVSVRLLFSGNTPISVHSSNTLPKPHNVAFEVDAKATLASPRTRKGVTNWLHSTGSIKSTLTRRRPMSGTVRYDSCLSSIKELRL